MYNKIRLQQYLAPCVNIAFFCKNIERVLYEEINCYKEWFYSR
jgi:hypothetical protein